MANVSSNVTVLENLSDDSVLRELIDFSESSFVETDDLSFVSGKTGKLLCYYELYKLENNHVYASFCDKIIKELYAEINESKNSNSLHGYEFSTGLCGFAYVLNIIQNDKMLDYNFESDLLSIDELVYNKSILELKNKNTDFLHGPIGVIHYLSERIALNSKADEYVVSLVDLLLESIVETSCGTYFENAFLYKLTKHIDYRNKVNFGTAHGQIGILLVLAKVYRIGLCRDKIKDCLKSGISYLLNYTVLPNKNDTYAYLPTMVECNTVSTDSINHEYYANSNMFWCYGDLGFVVLLHQVGKIFNDNYLLEKSLELGTNAISRTSSKSSGINYFFYCHGSIGVISVFKTLWCLTGNDMYEKAINFWLDRTFDLLISNKKHKDIDKFLGLLEGFEGARVVLSSPYKMTFLDNILIPN